MNHWPVIRVGTRGSSLALTQANMVVAALQAAHPLLTVELVKISTSGDRSQATNRPDGNWGQGVFVKEIELALSRGEIDVAVHSLKDVPPVDTVGLKIAAVPLRANPFDLLVSVAAWTLSDLPPGARIGTSSVRRSAFLLAARPDLEILPIRGNVETRFAKLSAGDYDAIVLAGAGVERLNLDLPHSTLNVETLTPAPGQGALGLQVRSDDLLATSLLNPLMHHESWWSVRVERYVMAAMQGGCGLPLAAYARPTVNGLADIRVAVASVDGSQSVSCSISGTLNRPEELGARAVEVMRKTGSALVN